MGLGMIWRTRILIALCAASFASAPLVALAGASCAGCCCEQVDCPPAGDAPPSLAQLPCCDAPEPAPAPPAQATPEKPPLAGAALLAPAVSPTRPRIARLPEPSAAVSPLRRSVVLRI